MLWLHVHTFICTQPAPRIVLLTFPPSTKFPLHLDHLEAHLIAIMGTQKGRSVRPVTWPWTENDRSTSSFYTLNHSISKAKTDNHEPALGSNMAPTNLNRELWTRNMCLVGLTLGWAVAITSLVLGVYIIAAGPMTVPSWLLLRVALVGPMSYAWNANPKAPYNNDHRVYSVSETSMVLIPLLLQLVIAFVASSLDAIHATSLRWALWREQRLRHNTNLRLFTFSRSRGPNGWPANIVASLGLILAYGGATVVTFPVTVTATLEYKKNQPKASPVVDYNGNPGPDRYGISFNGWGLAGLGIGFFLQSATCTWCLLHDAKNQIIGTWSSNPLATAKAYQHLITHQPNTSNSRSSLSCFAPIRPAISHPFASQPSLKALVPNLTRPLTLLLWGAFAIYFLFALIVILLSAKVQHTFSLSSVTETPASPNFPSIFKLFGLVSFKYNRDSTRALRLEWVGLLIQCIAVSPFVFGFHVAETLAGLTRDEATWRRAGTSTTGASLTGKGGILFEQARHWPSGLLFLCKAVVPWVFGYGFSCNSKVFMAVFPLLTVAMIFLGVACLGEYLVRWSPKGPQPATYGDIRSLGELVDDWTHDPLFWGDKGVDENTPGVRVAGIAGEKLRVVREGCLYSGLLSREKNKGET